LRTLDGIVEHLQLLSEHPNSGRPTSVETIRELVWNQYVMPYEIVNGSAYVLAIWHGSRNPDDKLSRHR